MIGRERGTRGFTFVEVAVALAIMAIAGLIILAVMPTLTRNVDEEIVVNELQINANRVLGDVMDRIRPGRLFQPGKGGRTYSVGETFVKYMVPVRPLGDPFFVTTTSDGTGVERMVMILGGAHPDAPSHGLPYLVQGENFQDFGPNDEEAIEAIPSRNFQFYEVARWRDSGRNFSEADHMIDLDGDEKYETTFSLGHIELVFPPSTATGHTDLSENLLTGVDLHRQPLCGDVVLWDYASGRKLPEIFSVDRDTGVLAMNFTSVALSEQGVPMVAKVSTQVSLRNNLYDVEWLDPNLLPATP